MKLPPIDKKDIYRYSPVALGLSGVLIYNLL